MSLLENYVYVLYGYRWIICVIKSAFIFPSELVYYSNYQTLESEIICHPLE